MTWRSLPSDSDGCCIERPELSYCLDCFHSTDLRSGIEALDRFLAVLSLDLPAARTLMTTFVLSPEAIGGLEAKSAFDEVLVVWRKAGVDC
ncbi:hypothetical protein [Streptomyces atratus]|uniref:hypothetical protein n=1 Tax=Streptomyces atratus TaxID=1893 RepID=UPI0021A4D303|nr:hypothetical protein [Streptomyces atratus]MCT2546905.1 hypothetical protein [Streptomyces atratus]